MRTVFLIIKREYLSRVTKKSFILLTLLVPLLFVGMMSLIVFLAVKQNDFTDKKKVEVIDDSHRFENRLKGTPVLQYTFISGSFETAKAGLLKSGFDYLLYIPASLDGVQLLGEKKAGFTTTSAIEDGLTTIIKSQRLAEAGIDTAVLARAQQPVNVTAMQMTSTGVTDAHSGIAFAVGLFTALLIYMSLFIYGTMVMRGVIEEKVSRIVEVIISSVKPFQLMLGKIIGVGLVGLTQFLLWIVISITLMVGSQSLMGGQVTANQVKSAQMRNPAVHAAANAQSSDVDISTVLGNVSSLPIGFIICCFLFYFLFGYFIYSAIFAVVGSAVDNETETQQFMLPVTLPLIFTFAIAQSFIVNNPDSNISVWLSMIPFTSPIAMMIRIPYGVPGWQVALSMALLVLGFLGTTWVAARIYRVGILMYGKKASYKELVKWFRYKD